MKTEARIAIFACIIACMVVNITAQYQPQTCNMLRKCVRRECASGVFPGEPVYSSSFEPWISASKTRDVYLASNQQARCAVGGSLDITYAITYNGGETWRTFDLPWTVCPNNSMKLDVITPTRSSDTSTVIAPRSGFMYAIIMAGELNHTDNLRYTSIYATRSTDGGQTWDPIQTVENSSGPIRTPPGVPIFGVYLDKTTINVHPMNEKYVYSVYHGLDQATLSDSAHVTVSTDYGKTWNKPVIAYSQPNPPVAPVVSGSFDGQQLVIIPEGHAHAGRLVMSQTQQFVKLIDGVEYYSAQVVVLLSDDKEGKTWSEPIIAADLFEGYLADEVPSVKNPYPTAGRPSGTRSGMALAEIAVSEETGNVYISVQAGDKNGLIASYLLYSTDAGVTWNKMTVAGEAGVTDAFYPSVAVQNGKIGYSYIAVDHAASNETFWAVNSWFKQYEEHSLALQRTIRLNDETRNFYNSMFVSNAYTLGDYNRITSTRDGFVINHVLPNNVSPLDGSVVEPLDLAALPIIPDESGLGTGFKWDLVDRQSPNVFKIVHGHQVKINQYCH